MSDQPTLCDDHQDVLDNFRHLRGRRTRQITIVRQAFATQCPNCYALNQRRLR